MPDTKVHEDVEVAGKSPRRRPALLAVGAVALLAIGLSAGLLLSRDDAGQVEVTTTTTSPERPQPVISQPLPAPDGEAVAGPAESPEDALRGFLTAEATGELAIAYTYLAPDEQDALGTAASYVAQHADLFGQVTGFQVQAVELDGGDPTAATVSGQVGFVPTLDVVVGLVPAKAEVRVPATRTDAGWHIRFSEMELEPILPEDSTAADDALAYVQGAVACEPPVRGYSGRLQGQARLVDELCDATGEASVGATTTLDDPVSLQPFLSSFGPDVAIWSRVVEVTGPTELRLVLAPYGDDWTVIGALPPQT